ncbi:hypothetical protein [Halomonas sp. HG01]|uniref:hypothetical protein n=1 Tax=Halomonas sp. HG01 TaxID=1609967 RepID=UPI0006146E27|nr:hypothetical protein [Halomonas sp. HG01]
MIYPDETLDYYADRFMLLGLSRAGLTLAQYLANPERSERLGEYTRLRLERHGVSFRQFLADPEAGRRQALIREPLLQAQHAASLRLWAAQDTGLSPRGACYDATPSIPLQDQAWPDLVARWRAETDAAERPVAHLPQRNGAAIEPLRHHRHPRSGAADFTRRKAQ